MGYLQDIKTIVRGAVIIDDVRDSSLEMEKVIIGSTAIVYYEGDDEPVEYTILGQKEVDLDQGRISCYSPIGSAIFGHNQGDQVIVKLNQPSRTIRMRIVAVERRSLSFDYQWTYWKDRIEQALLMETRKV